MNRLSPLPVLILLASALASGQSGPSGPSGTQGTGCTPTSCQFTFTININGVGNGVPGQQYSIFSPLQPSNNGSMALTAFAVVTVNGVTSTRQTTIPLIFVGFAGSGSSTEIIMICNNATHDVLDFKGGGATLNNKGRSGTATLSYGTDAFTGASGSSFFSYNFMCTADTTQAGICYNGNGNPNPDDFTANLSGSGAILLPVSDALSALPTLFPVPPPGYVSTVVNKTRLLFGQPPNPDNPFGSGSFRPVPYASESSTSAGSLTITPPWQYTDSTYTAAASCANLASDCWITIPTASGSIAAFTDTSVLANVNVQNLGPGVYPANVSLVIAPDDTSFAPSTVNTPLSLLVTGNTPILQLSESAIEFQSGPGATESQPHSIALSATAPISYQTSASTLAGGNWLTVTPASGAITSPASVPVGISANPAGLAPGSYFGRVDINAPGALTSWQSIGVELTVSSSGSAVPLFSPTALVFVTPQTQNPSSQKIVVSTFSPQPISFTVQGEEDDFVTWLQVPTASMSVQSGSPVTETISINTTGLVSGVYTGKVYETFSATQYLIPVELVVTPAVGACAPTQLLPVFTNLNSGFEFPAGQAVSLAAQIVDDCGSPLTAGVVQAAPSNGDPTVSMTALGNGQWTGTWLSHGISGGGASLALAAQSSTGLQGFASVNGTFDPNPTATVVTPGGIVSAANPVGGAPLAPGEFVSIYGSNLAQSTAASSGSSYQTTLGGVQVLLGGVPMPLNLVSSGLINAVVPFETPVNAIQELLISQGGAYSLPETVVVASTAPAIFTQSENGQGAGVIVVYKSNGTVFETSPTQPASAGDLLLIYASGLGAVNPPVADGAPGPSSAPFAATLNPVTATIGGVPATVSFAGLAPGFVGVYQVNVTVPAGVSPGPNVPVVLTTGGFSSAPATVTIQ